MAESFEMLVENIFHIQGRGTVFLGVIRTGIVRVGQTVEVQSATQSATAVVTGIEQGNKIQFEAKAGASIGLLIGQFDLKTISDGVEPLQGCGFRVVSLTLQSCSKSLPSTNRPWWKFW